MATFDPKTMLLVNPYPPTIGRGLSATTMHSAYLAAVTSAARRAAGRERTPIPEPLWSAGRP
jgi:hypothetical protein